MSRAARSDRRATRALNELARMRGIQTAYTGVDGARHHAEPETLTALLAAMRAPLDHPDDAPDALRSIRAAPPSPLEPVLVQWVDRPSPVRVRLPGDSFPEGAWLTLELESGEVQRRRLGAPAMHLRGAKPEDLDANTGEWEISLEPDHGHLPLGYHRLSLEAPGIHTSSLVIAAPRCPEPSRIWGVFLPLHALRAEGDWGIGRYRDLGRLRAFTEGLGGSFVGTLPLYPSFLEPPLVDPSPYLPVTRLGWNEIHVDPETLPELQVAEQARRLLGSTRFRAQLAACRGGELVDHAATMAAVRAVLEPMARALFSGPSARRDQLEAFVADRPHVAAYARFRASRTSVGSGDAFRQATEYHLYAQWTAETQLAAAAGERGTGLYLDLPVGVHPEGFDPVFEPDAFVRGIHVGAPPDAYFQGGQDWGFPPMSPHGGRAQEYRHLIGVLRHAMAHAGLLRIDHVMGLRRLYWIPEGADARHGAYVRYPHEELRAVVTLEASRARAGVIGEDLGTVPAEVRTAMRRDRMLRSWVLQFEATAENPLPDPPRASMASWGTHDLPRFAAFFDGTDIDEREARGDTSAAEVAAERSARTQWREALSTALGTPAAKPEGVLAGCLFHLASGPASATVVDLEDLWLERHPQNRPGTGAGAENWRRRAARSLEELSADPVVTAVLTGIEERRRAPSRGSSSRDSGSARASAAPLRSGLDRTSRASRNRALLTRSAP